MPEAGNEPQRTPGTLCALQHTVNGSDPILGNPPPPALTQVLHVHHMEGVQWKAPDHRNVRKGGGAEAEAKAGEIGTEDHIGGLSGLRETFGDGVGV